MSFNIWTDCPRVPITQLLEFIVDNRGKTVPTALSGHKLIATNCVTNNTLFPVYEKVRYLSDETYRTWFRAHPIPGDILFVNKGTPGRVCMVPDPVDFCIAQDMIALRANDSKIYNKYLFAVLRSSEIQTQIYNTNVGDVIPHFKKQFMDQLLIPVPERKIQEAIGDLYYTLSYKIEHNKKINDNLQQQIKVLVTAWLVDYAPFGGAMPSDWCNISLSAIADFVSGYSYKGAELQPSTTAMATIKNFDRNGGFKLDGFKELIPSSKIKPCHYAEKFDIVVAHTDLTQKAEVIGNAEPIINLAGYDSIVFSMDLVKVVPKDTRVSKFMLAALLQHPRFKAHCLGYVNGTTVLHLSKKALPDYELDFPTDPAVLAPLDDALRVLYMQMATIVDENRKLQDLRDTLLPQLMSGKIDVTDIDA